MYGTNKSSDWNSTNHLYSRIIVAGGGGGHGHSSSFSTTAVAGEGGGINGINGAASTR